MSDTAELQALVDAANPGDIIELTPYRSYVVAPTSSAPQGVLIPPTKVGIRMHGSGTSIVQATGVPSSFSSVMVKAPRFAIGGIIFRGGTQAPPVEADQHRHGLFVAASGMTAYCVNATGHTGDGIYLYVGADDALLRDCQAFGNLRNGFTFGGAAARGTFVGCRAFGNFAQQFDVETKSNGPVSNLVLRDCKIDALADYAITLGGPGFSLVSCEINGGINITNATDGTIERCWGSNPATSDKASVTVWGACTDIHLMKNTFVNATAKRGFWIASTNVGNPNRILVDRCDVSTGADGAAAVQISGAIDSSVIGGTMRGNGVRFANRAGISVRSVNVGAPIERFDARDVRLENFGQFGIGFAGLSTTPNALIKRAYVSGLSVGAVGRVATGIASDGALLTLVRGPGNVMDPGGIPLSIPASVQQIVVP